MKTCSQICTDAAQALMVVSDNTGYALRGARASDLQVDRIYHMLEKRSRKLGFDIVDAAQDLGWPVNDFRIFLLLNAAEALK